MIDSVSLKNFKCFENISLSFSRLTLLTGFNAAGKSTTLQAILLIVQGARRNVWRRHIYVNGPLLRLGIPSDLLMKGATEKLIWIRLQSNSSHVSWTLGPRSEDGNRLEAKVSAGNSTHTEAANGELNRVARPVIEALKRVVYISAERTPQWDFYPAPDVDSIGHANVGTHGQFAAWWFQERMDAELKPDRAHPDEKALVLRRQLNAWASYLFGFVEFNAVRPARSRMTSLEIRTSATDEWRTPPNVGYGLTYAFPILVACLLADSDQTLVIDSPEAHLHPRAQSRMGRFLAHMAERGAHVIIETHSDHLLNGIRLAVREKDIKPEHVTVHFFDPAGMSDKSIAHVTNVVVSPDGRLNDWPSGFFDQSEHDLASLAGWS